MASAEIFRLYATRLTAWANSQGDARVPVLLAAAADLLGTTSATVALRSGRPIAALVVSDGLAQEAHDLQTVLAEGPSLDADRFGSPVMAAGELVCSRWPRYGPAVAELGISDSVSLGRSSRASYG